MHGFSWQAGNARARKHKAHVRSKSRTRAHAYAVHRSQHKLRRVNTFSPTRPLHTRTLHLSSSSQVAVIRASVVDLAEMGVSGPSPGTRRNPPACALCARSCRPSLCRCPRVLDMYVPVCSSRVLLVGRSSRSETRQLRPQIGSRVPWGLTRGLPTWIRHRGLHFRALLVCVSLIRVDAAQ